MKLILIFKSLFIQSTFASLPVANKTKSAFADPNSSKTKLGISCTTREKRPKEEHGVSYFFISQQEFVNKINRNEFLEYAEVFGNLYGTPKDWVLSVLEEGKNVILELDIQGALQVKEAFPEAKTIFIIPPSYEDLSNRLKKRAQDPPEEIKTRLKEARKEVGIGKDFDQIIVNNDFDKALDDLKKFIFLNDMPSTERKEESKISLNLLLD